MEKIPLLVIIGPTASGKTDLAVRLAKAYDGEVISADSMQVYDDLRIITARPSEEEMCGVAHHLMGFVPLERGFSTAEYVTLAREKIAEVHSRGKLPILCGGTGLYVSSILDNVSFEDKGADPVRRAELEQFAEINGAHALWEKLRELDEESAEKIHENNVVRVIRAIEVCESTGIGFYEQRRRNLKGNCPYETCIIEIGFKDRADLYDRINRRVDLMVKQGMVEEARRVYETLDPKTAYQALGYKELIPYLSGNAELSDCLDRIRQGTRHYAKRQLTWFRRIEGKITVYKENSDENEKFFENVQKAIAKTDFLCYNRR